jgi:anti-anti-sigma factor
VTRFETTTSIVRDRAIVRARGYLSGHGGEQLEEEVGRILLGGSRSIVINFSETDMVNSVGVSILIGVIEKVRESEGALFFSGLTPVNEEIFRLMGLHNHVSFIDGDLAAWEDSDNEESTGESTEDQE